jgi:hypothetical protein
MTRDQCELLERIATGNGSFGNDDFKNPAANREFEMLVEQLSELESSDWIKLSTKRSSMTIQRPLYKAVATITEAGKKALADECGALRLHEHAAKIRIGQKQKAAGAKE